MWHAFLHAVKDTAILLPWLFLIYLIIELLENKTDLTGRGKLNGRLGPIVGSATGLIPQCGFSVMAAKLFEQKYITVGTLVAIFLSTSDEAFVILLSSGQGAVYLLPFIACKLIVGVLVGYALDGFFKLYQNRKTVGAGVKTTHDLFFERTDVAYGFECTSCGREHDEEKPFQTYFLDPLWHALKVAFFIFVVQFIIGAIIESVTEEKFASFMQKSVGVQPLLTAIIGLIPNCASSVVITECFLSKSILFGSCLAGLCANAGLGFLVLIKNTKKWKRNLSLLLTVYAVSVAVGYLANALVLLFN
jgi:hypothetical protein